MNHLTKKITVFLQAAAILFSLSFPALSFAAAPKQEFTCTNGPDTITVYGGQQVSVYRGLGYSCKPVK